MMGQISNKLRRLESGYTWYCPGCQEPHVVYDSWNFNGNFESPTWQPSILVTGKKCIYDANGKWTGEWERNPDGTAKDMRCHTFITDGMIQFLPDCTHALAGQTVPLPPLPDWLRDK